MHSLTTFQTPVQAKQVIYLTEQSQLPAIAKMITPSMVNEFESSAAQARASEPFIVLGQGSNVLFADNYDGLIIVNQLQGIETMSSTATEVMVRVAAGENWHEFVQQAIASGWYGLENLALIPGTVGAAPVQNIGAYGVEVCDYIDAVEVYDWETQTFETIPASACQFRYRDSLFKSPQSRQRYLITAVVFRLSQSFEPVLTYRELHEQFAHQPPSDAMALFDAVCQIRQNKLPDYRQIPNAGSFFKNPMITAQYYSELQAQFPDMPGYPVSSSENVSQVKVPAAWLIEKAGFKGIVTPQGAGVYEKHALILINAKAATGRAIADLAQEIRQTVEKQFTIPLEYEVRIVGQLGGYSHDA